MTEWEEKWEKEWEEKEGKFLNDIVVCKLLLDTLLTDYVSPGTRRKINSAKVTRARLMIHDILKQY